MEEVNVTINHVFLLGQVTNDVVVEKLKNDHHVLTFIVKTWRTFMRKGEWHKVPSTIKVVMWDKLADFVGGLVKKGNYVYISGRLETRYVKNDGDPGHIAMEVVATSVVKVEITDIMVEAKKAELESEGQA